MLGWEWPIDLFAGSRNYQSLQGRLIAILFAGLMASLIYQGMDVAVYYFIGGGVYYWAHVSGEVGDSHQLSIEHVNSRALRQFQVDHGL